MRELIVSGRVVDLILALIAFEALALALHHRATQRGIGGVDLFANLAPGVCLLLALRAALTAASWIWIAAALAVALFGHLLDLSRRWHRVLQDADTTTGDHVRRQPVQLNG